MNGVKENSAAFIAAIVISIILHTATVAGVSGISRFKLSDSFSHKIILADIISETPYKLNKRPSKEKSIPVKNQENTDNSFDKGLVSPPGTSRHDITVKENLDNGKEAPESFPEESISIKDSAVTKEDNNTAEENPERMVKIDETDAKKESSVQNREVEDTVKLLRYVRESFYFDIYWLGIYVGKAILEASSESGVVKITSQVYSAPVISTFYKVEDYAESRVINGAPANFRIKQQEGRYKSDKETVFDFNSNKITFSNYLKGTKDEHQTDRVLWDVISGFYFLRTQPLEVGKTVYIDIFDSNKILQAGVNVLRKEKIELPETGEIDTIVVQPVLKSEGLFQSKGDILIWLTDDENRVPIKVETKVAVGNVVAKLKVLETER